MSNLSSKRAQAPEPVKNIDLKPSTEDQSQKSDAKTNFEEKPVQQEIEVAIEKEAEVVTDQVEKSTNEEVKTEESSQQVKEVVAESAKEVPVDNAKQSPDAQTKEMEEVETKIVAEVDQTKEVPAVESNEKPVEVEAATKEIEKESVVEPSEAKPDEKKDGEVRPEDQGEKEGTQDADIKSKSKKRTLDEISNQVTLEPEADKSSQESKPDGIKRLKIDFECLDIKQFEKDVEVAVKVIDYDADKEEVSEVLVDKKGEELKDDVPAEQKEAVKEVSATKETCELFDVKPLFNTQSKTTDMCPSVIKDIPLSKMQQEAFSQNKEDAETANANATPSLNPEANAPVEEKLSKGASDIEAMYFNEVNKVSDQQDAQKVVETAVTQKNESQ